MIHHQKPDPQPPADSSLEFQDCLSEAYSQVEFEIMNNESSELRDQVAMEFARQTPKAVLDIIRSEVLREIKEEIRKNQGDQIREKIKSQMRQDFYSRIAICGDDFFEAKSFSSFLTKELAVMKASSNDPSAVYSVETLSEKDKEMILSKYLISQMLIKGGLS